MPQGCSACQTKTRSTVIQAVPCSMRSTERQVPARRLGPPWPQAADLDQAILYTCCSQAGFVALRPCGFGKESGGRCADSTGTVIAVSGSVGIRSFGWHIR
ncbi:hypothetical protein FHU29_004565 [Hoyosella altamirensis]|uniref:Uncharacterized protein n=1 Tax=Hoyosella altamirensis TaxID=616997 RepID=A0A839RU37_9ACTN|nr:hypothetical protein [Hoyosella altamirensis]